MRSKLRIPEDLLPRLHSGGLDPRDLVLYINSECNLRCRHCYIGNALLEKSNFLATDSVLDFLSLLPSLDRITVLGGEPLFHEGIGPILSAVASKNILEKRLTTNLTFLPRAMLELLVSSDIRVCVSIDGHSAELHEEIRGKGSFEKTINNLRALVEAEADIEVTHTVTSHNIRHLQRLIELLRDLGVRRLNLHKVSIKGNASEDLDITPTRWRTLLRDLESIHPPKERVITVRYEVGYVTEEEMADLLAAGYRNHAQASYYAQTGHRIVLYPDGKIYTSSESFGTKAFIGSFGTGVFELNSLPQNELSASLEPSFDVSHLDAARKGDPAYPIPVSVSFRRSTEV